MVVNILVQLLELGFSEYEARAYLGLLKHQPATAYEVAKKAGLPTSKIYEVLSRLSEKSVVMEIMEKGKRRYIPIEPDEFVEKYRGKMEQTLSALNKELPLLKQEAHVSYIWNLTEYGDFINKARQLIEAAEAELLISTWKQELEQVSDLLTKKEEQNVKIAVVHFGRVEQKIGMTFPHPIENTIYAEKGGRGFVLISDSREALMATVRKEGKVEGAWSKNRGFVTLAEDYVKHDVYIMKIVERFDIQLIERFGNNYKKLRDVYHDEEEEK
ncbi:MAG: TrmB family transcriptional regulator [Spirochaetales bacterium]|nr:TrmB family transcriptional regulator [Spirochaetales bacterium]